MKSRKEALRGRHQRHQGGDGRGHRARRRAGAAAGDRRGRARRRRQCEGDERTGLRILKRALEAPTRQIAENSAVDGGVVVDRMRAGTGNYGFDAARGRVRGPGRGRHHRPDQGGARRAGERRVGGRRPAADRGDPDGASRGEARGRRPLDRIGGRQSHGLRQSAGPDGGPANRRAGGEQSSGAGGHAQRSPGALRARSAGGVRLRGLAPGHRRGPDHLPAVRGGVDGGQPGAGRRRERAGDRNRVGLRRGCAGPPGGPGAHHRAPRHPGDHRGQAPAGGRIRQRGGGPGRWHPGTTRTRTLRRHRGHRGGPAHPGGVARATGRGGPPGDSRRLGPGDAESVATAAPVQHGL